MMAKRQTKVTTLLMYSMWRSVDGYGLTTRLSALSPTKKYVSQNPHVCRICCTTEEMTQLLRSLHLIIKADSLLFLQTFWYVFFYAWATYMNLHEYFFKYIIFFITIIYVNLLFFRCIIIKMKTP